MNLTTELHATLIAAMDRLIPEDEYPSASQNGVPNYLARQFDGDLSALLPMYRAGLESLDREARAAYGLGFAEMDGSRQDVLLSRVEAGHVEQSWTTDPSAFFTALVEHVAEGYYADPEHNLGNPGKASWKMIGFVERTGFEGPSAPMLGGRFNER